MRRLSRSRPLRVESLESRRLLTGCFPIINTDTNPSLPADVNADGAVSPLDALIVVNELNVRAHSDPVSGAISCDSASNHYLDPSGDSHVSPLDALAVVNAIGANPIIDLDIGTSFTEATVRLPWDVSTFAPFGDQVTIREGASKLLQSAHIVMHQTYGEFHLQPVDTKGTSISAQFDAETNTLHLTGADLIDNYLTVLRGLTFRFETDTGFGSLLTLNVTVDDGVGSSSAPAFVSVEDAGKQLIGAPLNEAIAWAGSHGRLYRFARIDDVTYVVTADFRLGRLNFSVDDGIVTGVSMG